ncbi:MAG: hypothetical protein KGM42_04600 [Hyphomicrobiales bacterium]|nr:hypothetical protein [Hyphomicrobiales bacterium]
MGTEELTQTAKDAARAAGAAANEAIGAGNDFARTAADFASGAREKVVDEASRQKKAGADYLDGLAGTLDRVAGEIDREMPFAGDMLRSAGRQAEYIADSIRNGDVRQMMRGATDFARANPTAAFGIAMLAGFGLMRLVKSGATQDGGDA